MVSTNPIQQSFELASGRCEDLTPLVYRRLFDEHPQAVAMFRSEGSELVKGSILALTIEAILDFAGERNGHFRMIECEVTSHDAYGTPRELFVAFFGVIAATLRDVLGRRLVAGDRSGVVAAISRRDRKRCRRQRGLTKSRTTPAPGSWIRCRPSS
jgi:hypothetical protein